MDYIEAADDRARLKAAKTRKFENTIKKEAVRAARKEESGKKTRVPK